MKKILTLLILLGFNAASYASCGAKHAFPLFSCTMKGNAKHLEICGTSEGIEYTFGHSLNNPELNFYIDKLDSYYEFILGPYWVQKDLYLPRGNVTYVLRSFFRGRDDIDINQLEVYINGKKRATLVCEERSINDNLTEETLFTSSREATQYDEFFE